MTTLLSCVGDSDPIRNRHDGPLLHLARCLRPEKIVLIQSEHSREKKEDVIKALTSIDGYIPEIREFEEVISNNDVFVFDKMFKLISDVTQKVVANDDVILNLTSGTPQMISAMFSVNRINDLNVQAFQVATPVNGSNEHVEHDNEIEIAQLIDENLDNTKNFKCRIIEDKSEKFQATLLKKTLRDLIKSYDYEPVYDFLIKNKIVSQSKKKHILNILEDINNAIKYQKLISQVAETDYSEDEKALLNAYLIIELQARRGLVAEVLIRAKNLAEFVSEMYLKQNHPGVITANEEDDKDTKPYLNVKDNPALLILLNKDSKKEFKKSDYLSLPAYTKIIASFDTQGKVADSLKEIDKVNFIRNKVAHGFKSIDQKQFKLSKVVNASEELTIQVLNLDEKWQRFYDRTNQDLLNDLK